MLNIFTQAKVACEEADKIIFIVDGKEGLNPIDYDIANVLRKSGLKVSINCLFPPTHFKTGATNLFFFI